MPYRGDLTLPDDARTIALSDDQVQTFGTTAVRASWAQLADFAGNTDAFRRWSPETMSDRVQRVPRERRSIETPDWRAV